MRAPTSNPVAIDPGKEPTMNRKAIALAVVAASFTFVAPVANAMQGANTPEARAAEAAKKGADHLRWFVHRTRMIYSLDIRDFYHLVP